MKRAFYSLTIRLDNGVKCSSCIVTSFGARIVIDWQLPFCIGYISFILLFELIIFLIDHWLVDISNGAPTIIVGTKVLLVGIIIVPLHHWMGHRIMKYLSERDLLIDSKYMFSNFWLRLRKKISFSESTHE